MTDTPTYRNYLDRLIYFFPFQLVILHFKKNHLLLVFWFILFGYITQSMAVKYGVPYLFLYPEYLGEVGFASHFILGFAVGGFIMAFNIYTYIIHAYRFPFLATVSKPFYKFCLNNFIIPLAFVVTYMSATVAFQRTAEFETPWRIVEHLLGFSVGVLLFFLFSFFYFFRTNKDFTKFENRPPIASPAEDLDASDGPETGRDSADSKGLRPRKRWSNEEAQVKTWRVETYLRRLTSISLARHAAHYDEDTMRKVFYQNHINASIFELLLVGAFFIVSTFDNVDLFVIPAGASVLLVFTLILMLISVFLSWFRGWTLTILLGVVMLVNLFTTEYSFLPVGNQLYGLDYSTAPADYQRDNVHLDSDDPQIDADRSVMMAVLDQWKRDNQQPGDSSAKPVMLLVNSSGGGLRSSMWTVNALCALDERLDGRLMDKTALMSGASGGMLGAAYVRDESMETEGAIYPARQEMMERMGRDLLNPVLFSIASSDLFFRFREIDYNGRRYDEDRAYKFEQQYIDNVGGATDRPLGDYVDAERSARIPMMILSPTIINDGRRLLVSPLPISHLCNYSPSAGVRQDEETENVEFTRLFADHSPLDTRFTSLLRASATFPYILPQVSLPAEPAVELMDAGIRDNFGFKTSLQFIHGMREWISANTSGVVIVQIRDKNKKIVSEAEDQEGLLDRLTSPVGNVYGNFTKTHDFTHDQLLLLMSDCVDVPIDEVSLQLEESSASNISMSWHLTSLEKTTIEKAIDRPDNIEALDRIIELLERP